MVIKLSVEDGILIGQRESDKRIIEYGAMPVHRPKKNPIERNPRWLKGPILTEEAALEESYTSKMHIA